MLYKCLKVQVAEMFSKPKGQGELSSSSSGMLGDLVVSPPRVAGRGGSAGPLYHAAVKRVACGCVAHL